MDGWFIQPTLTSVTGSAAIIAEDVYVLEEVSTKLEQRPE